MPVYSDSVKRQAVARSREIGIRAAARELAIDVKTLRAWRRAENKAASEDDAVFSEVERLERQIPTADLHTLGRINERIEQLARQAGIAEHELIGP
jgi:transposase-like protein